MEGSLFVNAQATAGDTGAANSALVLNSASGKVALTGANASVSKSETGNVDLQVLEGKATLQGKDGQTKNLEKGTAGALGTSGIQAKNVDVKIISPGPGGQMYIDPDQDKPVTFQWKGYPKDWTVSLFAGPTRKQMREWAVAAAESEKVSVQFPLGKHFWKLVAKDSQGQIVSETSVTKVEIFPRSAPTVIFPTTNALLESENEDYTMTFKWQRAEEAKQILIEVAKDPMLREKIANNSFTTEESFEIPNFEAGTYYWRMVAYYPGQEKPLLGKVQKFTVAKKIIKVIEPLEASWDTTQGSDVQYFVEKPQVSLAWEVKNRQDEVGHYKIKIIEETASLESAQNFDVKDPKIQVPVLAPGRYLASVEVYNKTGEKLIDLPPRTIAVSEAPLLPAPKILIEGSVIKSASDGKSQIQWQEVSGAEFYQVLVTDSEGKLVSDKKFKKTSAVLANMPGEYKLQVVAVDSRGRAGEKDEPKTLVVPPKSALRAPALKGIKVN